MSQLANQIAVVTGAGRGIGRASALKFAAEGADIVCVINVSSITGLIGNAGQCNYAASKAGLIGFTKSVARELASRGITANALAPGFVETDMTAALSEEVRRELMQKIPLNALGQPDDIANAVLFLASPAARYITGQ